MLLLPSSATGSDSLEDYSSETVLGNVIPTYPNLESASLQIQQSLLELDRINSTLGWH
jgi:hypothetical protein